MFTKMRRNFSPKFVLPCLLLFLSAAGAFAFDAAEVCDIYFQALKAEEPMPSVEIDPGDRTEGNAYRVQALLVERLVADRNDSVAGYKGGLTTAAQMQRFESSVPVSAPLFKSGLIEAFDPSETIEIASFGGMMLETEFAFKTAVPITEPVKDETTLRGLIASVHPAIEIPQVYFADMPSVRFFEITAAAVGSRLFLVGPPRSTDADFDAMKVVLTCDESVLSEGMGIDALDGQWSALLWLVNNVLAQGGKIEAGQYFITGVLGKMVPAVPGLYKAEYPFGSLTLKVTAP